MKLIIGLKAFSVGLISMSLGLATAAGMLQHLVTFNDTLNEFAFAGICFTLGILGIFSSLTFKRK
jgi:hypothetical protein